MIGLSILAIIIISGLVAYTFGRFDVGVEFPKLNKTLRLITLSFTAGVIYKMGFDMFLQDMLGLEEYLKFINKNWSDISPLFGLAVLMGGLYWYIFCLNSVKKMHSLIVEDGDKSTKYTAYEYEKMKNPNQ